MIRGRESIKQKGLEVIVVRHSVRSGEAVSARKTQMCENTTVYSSSPIAGETLGIWLNIIDLLQNHIEKYIIGRISLLALRIVKKVMMRLSTRV